jgi:hypothetical protein
MRRAFKLLVVLAAAVLASAPTLTKLPDGAGTYSDWGCSYTDLATNDGDGSICLVYWSGYGQSFPATETKSVGNLPADAVFVDSVVSHVLYRLTGGANVGISHFGYAGAYGSAIPCSGTAVPNGSYQDYVCNYPVGPGGVAWTPTLFNAAEFGFQSDGDPSPDEDLRVTQLYVLVTYRSPAGIFTIRVDPE